MGRTAALVVKGMSLAFCTFAPLAVAQEGEYELSPGFVVERVAAAADSFIALTFDADGRLLLSAEGTGLLVALDDDGDGFYEGVEPLTTGFFGVQGLCADDRTLFAIGRRRGADGGATSGVWRLALDEAGAVASVERMLGIDDHDEHGAHGIVRGPDGSLYATIGDHARIQEHPAEDSPLLEGYEGALLSSFADPNGYGRQIEYPYGHVARIDPVTAEWRYHSVGYRNAYDLAFTLDGNLFTCDSDMERDVGLPWYRPVRLLHCEQGVDFGSRKGSGTWPGYYADTIPAIALLGRGSPTGIAVYAHDRFPDRYHGALLVGDWSRGRILAFHMVPGGSTFEVEEEVLLQARGALPVTDLAVGPDGALYFTTGGRGTAGGLFRLDVATATDAGPASTDPIELAIRQPQPQSAWSRRALDALRERAGDAWLGGLADAATDPDRTATERAHAQFLMRTSSDASASGMQDRSSARFRSSPRVLLEDIRRTGSLVAPKAARQMLMILEETPSAPPFAEGEMELVLDVLRCLEVAFLISGPPNEQWKRQIEFQLLDRFPSSDPRINRELAVLLAWLGPEEALERLLSWLEGGLPREEQIHMAYCLRVLRSGWTREQRARFFAWFEEAFTWKGGGSFEGYLDAMFATFVESVPPADALALAESGRLGTRSLARLVTQSLPQDATALFEPLKRAFAELEGDADAGPQRRSIVEAVGGADVPGLAAWLREIHDENPPLRPATLIALARLREAQDWKRFVGGISPRKKLQTDACVRALLALPRKPSQPPPYRTLLDAARRRGTPSGWRLVRLLERWAGKPEGSRDESLWNAQVQEWERWFAERFPDYDPPSKGETGPEWGSKTVAAFLERTAERPASSARGAAVYTAASCNTCHTMDGGAAPEDGGVTNDGGRLGTGWGPDLTTIAHRFTQEQLLEAIWEPSQVVAERYRTTIVATTDGEVLDGRIVEEDDTTLTLLHTDGERTRIETSAIEAQRLSDVSPMPTALLDGQTLEEIRDLFAYLEAEGRVDAQDARAAGWIDLLSPSERKRWTGGDGHFTFRGHQLVGRGQNLGESVYLMHESEWGDFELEFDVRVEGDNKANSGLQYRSRLEPDSVHPVGYQADIGQVHWGSLYATDGRAKLAGPELREWGTVVRPKGWNHYYVRVAGDRHTIEVNGATLADVTDAAHAGGRIGLQLHENTDMTVRFANLRIRPLSD